MFRKLANLFGKPVNYPLVTFEEIPCQDFSQKYPDALNDLFTEKKDGFLIKNFLSQEEVNALLSCVDKVKKKEVAHTEVGFTYPMVFAELSRKINALSESEKKQNIENYFLANKEYIQNFKTVYGVDIPGKLQSFFEKISGGRTLKIASGYEQVGYYPFGTFRYLKPEKGIVSVHCGNYFQSYFLDFYAHLSNSVKVKNQLSYFILLNKAENGGELSVFNLRWEEGQNKPHPGIDDFIFQPNGKKLFVDNAKGMQKLKVDPQPGDLILFQGGTIWHRVERVLGIKSRITFGGFMGTSHDGQTVYYWS